jgi:hypothetical protein
MVQPIRMDAGSLAGVTRSFLSAFIRGGEAASVFICVSWHEGSR